MVYHNESFRLPSTLNDEDSERLWHGYRSYDTITDPHIDHVSNLRDVAVTTQSTDNTVIHVELATIGRRSPKRALSF